MTRKVQVVGFRNSLSFAPFVCLVFIASLLVSGCATTGKPERSKFRQPPMIIPPAAHASGRDVLDWIAAMSGKARSLKGMAKVKIVSGKKESNAREVIAVKRPAYFRLETLGFIGAPSMIITTAGAGYSVQVPTENKVLRWDRVSTGNPVPVPFLLLETKEIVDIFLGGTPIIDHDTVDIEESGAEKSYTLTILSRDGLKKQVLVIDDETFQIRTSDIYDGLRDMVISLSYGDYQNVEGMWFPLRIEAGLLPGLESVQIRFEDVELNPMLDDDLFVLKETDR